MTTLEQAFVDGMLGNAKTASAATGFLPSVILAQWANETNWGRSPAWVYGHNFAGVSPGGALAGYPTIATGLAAYIATANSPLYNPVRAAKPAGSIAQARALGASPWAGSHYEDLAGVVGQALVDLIVANNLTQYDPTQLPSSPPKEALMQAILVNGTPTVYAASPAGHLLEFTKAPTSPGGWSVIDVTDSIAAAFPAVAPFEVQP